MTDFTWTLASQLWSGDQAPHFWFVQVKEAMLGFISASYYYLLILRF